MSNQLPAHLAARGVDLVIRFVSEISEQIGQAACTIDDIEIAVLEEGPALRIEDDGRAVVFVGPNALKYEPVFVANLAHEAVHLHEGTIGYASGLEEGFAVAFELSKIAAEYGVVEKDHFFNHLPPSYVQVLRDYEYLVSVNPEGVRTIRSICGRLSGMTAFQLWKVIPDIGLMRSWRLTRRKQMR